MTVRAKFTVQYVEDNGEGLKTIHMAPVYGGEEGNENNEYWKYTPAGLIQLSTINEAASSQFTQGQEFYVDFTAAEKDG